MFKPVEIIAEAGVNHNGDSRKAFEMIDAAVDAGVDTIKFQTFKSEKLVSARAEKAPYQRIPGVPNESQREMLSHLELSHDTFRELKKYADTKGLKFMSTAFDDDSLSFVLNELNLQVLKIPSGEVTNGPLLLNSARGRRPMYLSTGMATIDEIKVALSIVAFGLLGWDRPSKSEFNRAYDSVEGRDALTKNVVLLHCTTEYPTNFESVNLRAMVTIKETFQLRVGYSDHSMGELVPCIAVALGAQVIEKHFTLDRNMSGPDHKASLEPSELKNLVNSIRSVEVILGSSSKEPQRGELDNKTTVRKSLVAAAQISVGDLFTVSNISVKRPENGRSPIDYWDVLGSRAQHSYKVDDPIK